MVYSFQSILKVVYGSFDTWFWGHVIVIFYPKVGPKSCLNEIPSYKKKINIEQKLNYFHI